MREREVASPTSQRHIPALPYSTPTTVTLVGNSNASASNVPLSYLHGCLCLLNTGSGNTVCRYVGVGHLS